MNYTYSDQLDGFFALSQAPKWLEANSQTPLSFYSIFLNFGETMIVQSDFSSYQIKPNSIVFVTPGSYVSSIETKDDRHYLIDFNQAFYCLELHDKELSCDGLLFGAMPGLPILHTNTKETADNQHLIRLIEEEFQQNDSTQGDMLRLLLKRLIIISVRLGRQQLFRNIDPPQEETDDIRKFQALVEKHFRTMHKVADYADLLYKSPKTLSNTFKRLYGASPLQIIQERIILEAKREMYYTDKPIKEIAYDLGFSEAAQFSRLFKNVAGQSPSEYQEQLTIPPL